MKVLIAYASKTGSTRKAAEELAKYFKRVDLVDLAKEMPDPSKYTAVVVGSPIHAGKILKPVRTFLENNEKVLAENRTGYFICNMMLDQTPMMLKNNFPSSISRTAVAMDSFGGEMKMENAKGFEKFFIKMFTNVMNRKGSNIVEPVIQTDRIKVFAEQMQEALELAEED
ncbi:MAG: hypothetical protein KBS83_00800 [Lachnospiraceae bacterium]|nr:hypothetical protein [Candidatus Equihabitans merdae]